MSDTMYCKLCGEQVPVEGGTGPSAFALAQHILKAHVPSEAQLNEIVKDKVLGLDWREARYIGDGVYMADSSDLTGIPSIALRTDRKHGHQDVIVLEDSVFNELVHAGQALFTFIANKRRIAEMVIQTGPLQEGQEVQADYATGVEAGP